MNNVSCNGFEAEAGAAAAFDARQSHHLPAPQLVDKAMKRVDGVEMRNVGRGHPLFGPACGLIRSEALVRIDGRTPLPHGLLVLGQRSEQKIEGRHGSELLLFLGNGLAAMIRRWLTNSTTA